MTIRELRILPPLAIARLGSASEPLDNYTILNKERSLSVVLKAGSCDVTCLDPLEKEQITRRFRAAVRLSSSCASSKLFMVAASKASSMLDSDSR